MMHTQRISFLTHLIIAITLVSAQFSPKEKKNAGCSTVDELLLNGNERVSAPTEHQWVGRILFRQGDVDIRSGYDEVNNETIECLAVLISKKNLVAPAHCFSHLYGVPEAYSIRLGTWNLTADPNEWSCNDEGYCVPPSQTYKLSEIAIHPDYDQVTFNNNIAVLTLEKEVTVTNYVAPICWRPAEVENETLVEQYYHMVGFHTMSNLRQKTGVKTMSRRFCEWAHGGLLAVFTSTQFCGYQTAHVLYEVGSPLAGVYVQNGEEF